MSNLDAVVALFIVTQSECRYAKCRCAECRSAEMEGNVINHTSGYFSISLRPSLPLLSSFQFNRPLSHFLTLLLHLPFSQSHPLSHPLSPFFSCDAFSDT